MKKQSRTVPRRRQSVSPTPRHLPLVDILIDTQAELQELVVASGLKVLEAMLEEDRAAVCGPRYAHQPARQAYRTGHTPSQVVLGGRKVAIRRPRARRADEEVPLPTARAFANADPLNRRVVDQMLIGVATRQYARSKEGAYVIGATRRGWGPGETRPHTFDPALFQYSTLEALKMADYEGVLNDLRLKRAKVQRELEMLESASSNLEELVSPVNTVQTERPQVGPRAFARMTSRQAAEQFLRLVGKPQTTREVFEGVRDGGFRRGKPALYNTMLRYSKGGDSVFVRRDGQWFLRAWETGATVLPILSRG